MRPSVTQGRNRAVAAPILSAVVFVASFILFVPLAVADSVIPDPSVDLGVEVVLAPVALIPNNSFGVAPRINAIATVEDRLFVVTERDGLIYELQGSGHGRLVSVFFDVASAIDSQSDNELDVSSLFHGGLRSLAFHPDFASNGLFYVSVMMTRPADPGSHHYLSDPPNPIGADSVLLEFTVDPISGVALPESYREVFRVGMPVYDHPIKQIAFDPFVKTGDDGHGLLYIGHGDGSVQSAIAGGGQMNDALGKILRIDPLESGSEPYSIPVSNPFVGDDSMLDEVYSLGHRNPHNLSFAQVDEQGALIVAEPGRDNVEEINVIVAGADYGWPQREGTFVHEDGGGVITGVSALPINEVEHGFTFPAIQYGHDGVPGSFFNGTAVTGGYAIDNGSDLSGQYFFADFPETGALFHSSTNAMFGAVTKLNADNPARNEPVELTQAQIGAVSIRLDHDNSPATAALQRTSLLDVFDDSPSYSGTRADVRFGQGPVGELYVMSKRNNTIYLVINSLPVSLPVQNGLVAEATTIDEILAATDYQSSDADLLRLYRAFFDREPDVEGAKYWIDIARQGHRTAQIVEYFGISEEFTRRYGQVSDATFLATVYRNTLDRDYDSGGFAYWLDQMEQGLSHAQVVLYFSLSQEFRNNYPYLPAS